MGALNQPSSSKKALEGKNIVCFGDSVTANYYVPNYIAKNTGATIYNVAVGGTCLSTHDNPDYIPFCMTKLADAVATNDFTAQDASPLSPPTLPTLKSVDFSTIDYATIFFGTNDYAKDFPLGVDSDNGDMSFKGAMNYVIETFVSAHPHIKILFVTPFWRARIFPGDGLESDSNPNGNGTYLIEFAEAMIDRANAHHILSLDMYRGSGINAYNEPYYLRDGLHPTDVAGCELLGNKIGTAISNKY